MTDRAEAHRRGQYVDRTTRNRRGTRYTLYGLPGGYVRARRAGELLDPALFRHAVALATFRAPLTDAYTLRRRAQEVTGWALRACVVAP